MEVVKDFIPYHYDYFEGGGSISLQSYVTADTWELEEYSLESRVH